MKRAYSTPVVEFEAYSLTSQIVNKPDCRGMC